MTLQFRHALAFIFSVLLADAALAVPTANPGSFTLYENDSISINLIETELAWDIDNHAWSVTAIPRPPAHGTVEFSGATITYTPSRFYYGSDEFEYQVTDATGAAARNTISITVLPDFNVNPQVTAINIDTSEATTQVAQVNDVVVVRVRVTDETGQPIPQDTAFVTWTITETATGTTVNVATNNSIDLDGYASASFTSATTPTAYRVDVAVDMLDESASATLAFDITTGLESHARPNTPESAMGAYLDWLCPRLPAEDALVERCNEINAADSESQLLGALRALAPEEAAAQTRTGTSFGQTQLNNIGGRLNALRAGARGFALSGLAFNIKGEIVPGSVFASLFGRDARGGGASADDKLAAPRWSGFLSGNVGGGERDRTSNESGFDFQTRGLTGGMDYRYSNSIVFGAALGYASSEVDISSNGGALDAAGYNLALYGTWYRSNSVYLDAVLNYANNNYEQKRNISYTVGPTTVNETARAEPDGRLFALSLGGGYEYAFNNGVSVEGSLHLRYLDTTVDGYTETGAGALNLKMSEQNTNLFTSSLGGRASWPLSYQWGVLIPQFDFSWEHDYDTGADKIKGSFAADQFQNQFVFKTDTEDSDYFQTGLGVSAVIPGGTTAFVQYQTTLGRENFRDWNVALGGRIEFN